MRLLRQGVYSGLRGDGKPVRSLLFSFAHIDEITRFLRRMIHTYKHNPVVREAAVEAIQTFHAPPKDKFAQALAIAEWAQQNVMYLHEPNEVFQTPTNTLRTRAGDCDDFTTLQCSMMASVAIPERMCLMSINGQWKHIFPVFVSKDKKKIPLDATLNQPVSELPNAVDICKARGDHIELLFG